MKTTTLEQSLQDRILYIGTEIPEAVAKDTRQKFVLLGTPQELINEHQIHSSIEEPRDPMFPHASKCPKLYGQKCECDGSHTFDELYDHRITLYIALCKSLKNGNVWRSKFHSDGSCFIGWFVLGIWFEKGKQITYHLPNDRWNETNFAHTIDKAPEFDGHTSDDVLARLKML